MTAKVGNLSLFWQGDSECRWVECLCLALAKIDRTRLWWIAGALRPECPHPSLLPRGEGARTKSRSRSKSPLTPPKRESKSTTLRAPTSRLCTDRNCPHKPSPTKTVIPSPLRTRCVCGRFTKVRSRQIRPAYRRKAHKNIFP